MERQTLSNNNKLLHFQNALALQCFTNEFVYEETEQETLAVVSLEAALQQSFAGDEDLSPYHISCLASYRPLHLYPWANYINPPPGLETLLERQVLEVSQELALRKNIPRLKLIENNISLAVQKQYEENDWDEESDDEDEEALYAVTVNGEEQEVSLEELHELGNNQ